MRAYNISATLPSIFCILKPLKNYDTGYYLHLLKTPRNVWYLAVVSYMFGNIHLFHYSILPPSVAMNRY